MSSPERGGGEREEHHSSACKTALCRLLGFQLCYGLRIINVAIQRIVLSPFEGLCFAGDSAVPPTQLPGTVRSACKRNLFNCSLRQSKMQFYMKLVKCSKF